MQKKIAASRKLSIYINMSFNYLKKFESQKGKEGISLEKLFRISIVLDVTMDKFFEE